MTETEFSMWDAPAEQITASRVLHTTALAKAAVEPLWPYLSAAKSLPEFESRLALSGDAMMRMIGEVIEDPSLPTDQMRVVATQSLVERFAAHQRDREAARAQKGAQRAAQRVQDAVADSLRAATAAEAAYCPDCYEKKFGYEPDMGDDDSTFAPGTCANCGKSDGIVFTPDSSLKQGVRRIAAVEAKVASIDWQGDTHFGVGYLTGVAPNGDIYEVYSNPNSNPTPASWVNYGPEGDTGIGSGIAESRGFATMQEAMADAEAHAAGRTSARHTAAGEVRCTYDSGSMYGNTGQCPNPAQWVVTYQNGTSGPFNAPVCEAHLGAMKGRVYPGLIEVAPIRVTSSRRTAEWDMRTSEQAMYDSGYLNGKRDREGGYDPQGVGFGGPGEPQTDYERGYWAGYGLKEGGRRTAGREVVNNGVGKPYVKERKGKLEYRYYNDGSVTILDTSKAMGTNRTVGHTGPNPDRVPSEFKQGSIHGSLHTAPGGGPHAPYNVEQRGDKWVVVNDLGEVKGTFDSKEKAREQQKALYANVPGASEQAERKSSSRQAAWTHENARHAFDHGWDVGTREASGQQVPADEHGSTNYAGEWSEGYREGLRHANEDVLDFRHSEPDWVAASSRTAAMGWVRDLSHDDDSAISFALDTLGQRLRITFEDGDMEWGHFEKVPGGAPEWKGERNDYTFPIDFGAVVDMTRVSEPAPAGQGELFDKGPYDLTASRSAVAALLREVEADKILTCVSCGMEVPRSEAYLRSNVGGDAPLAYCPQCAARMGWAPQHRYEKAAAARSAVDDLLASEAAFFHHPQRSTQPDPPMPGDQLSRMRSRDRAERTEEADTERRHDEYWDAHPEEAERHRQQNAASRRHIPSRRQGASNPKMDDPDYAAGFKAGVDDADKARGFSLQNYSQSSNSSFAEGYYAGYDGWYTSDAYWMGTESSRRTAVNEDGYGSERYQRLEAPTKPDWVHDAWDEGKAPQEMLDQGRAAHEPENPFADTLTTIRQTALRMVGEGDHSEVTPSNPGSNIEGFEQNSDFDRPTQPRTTRPRVMPGRTPESTNPPDLGDPDGHGHEHDYPGDPMYPTVAQRVHARVTRLAAKVQMDNPTMAPEEARRVAARTVAAYPEMVSVQR